MDIRRSDDVNAVVQLHRAVYEGEFGLDESFAREVATRLAELRRAGFPGPREGLWLAEADGVTVGSITLNEEDRTFGRFGHLVLLPEARGTGAGRRLVETVLDAARGADYERLELYTFSELDVAGGLYRSMGFEKVSGERVMRWGRPMEWERYELALTSAG